MVLGKQHDAWQFPQEETTAHRGHHEERDVWFLALAWLSSFIILSELFFEFLLCIFFISDDIDWLEVEYP